MLEAFPEMCLLTLEASTGPALQFAARIGEKELQGAELANQPGSESTYPLWCYQMCDLQQQDSSIYHFYIVQHNF